MKGNHDYVRDFIEDFMESVKDEPLFLIPPKKRYLPDGPSMWRDMVKLGEIYHNFVHDKRADLFSDKTEQQTIYDYIDSLPLIDDRFITSIVNCVTEEDLQDPLILANLRDLYRYALRKYPYNGIPSEEQNSGFLKLESWVIPEID